MSHIPENFELASKCTRNLVETIIYTFFNEHPEEGETAPKHVETILMWILKLFLRQPLVH